MNFKFENDLENNLMLLTVTTKLRKKLNQPRVTCGFKKAKILIEENYSCPETHTLGGCLNRRQVLDNTDPAGCAVTWKFNLIPIEKDVKKTPAPRRSRTKKTSVKKSKDD